MKGKYAARSRNKYEADLRYQAEVKKVNHLTARLDSVRALQLENGRLNQELERLRAQLRHKTSDALELVQSRLAEAKEAVFAERKATDVSVDVFCQFRDLSMEWVLRNYGPKAAEQLVADLAQVSGLDLSATQTDVSRILNRKKVQGALRRFKLGTHNQG